MLSFLSASRICLIPVGVRVFRVMKWKILEKVQLFSNVNTKPLPANLKAQPTVLPHSSLSRPGQTKLHSPFEGRGVMGQSGFHLLSRQPSHPCALSGQWQHDRGRVVSGECLCGELQPLRLSVGPLYSVWFSFVYVSPTTLYQIFTILFISFVLAAR